MIEGNLYIIANVALFSVRSVERMSLARIVTMKSVQELVSPYRGSEKTYEMVKEQIEQRWGENAAEEYDPHTDCMPFSSWVAHGFVVKKGQKALKSITFVEVKDENDKIVRKIKRCVNLFHKRQVEKIV